MEKGWFKKRLKTLVYKMLSLSFITWVVVLIVWIIGGQKIDVVFLSFTAAVIGLKSFFKERKNEKIS